jgi:hypothetical protein
VTRELLGETQAQLEPEQAAKINVPVLLVIGEECTDPAKPEIEAVAAALPDAQILVLAGQQHIADILDPATFAEHLLGFLRPDSAPRIGCPCLSRAARDVGVAKPKLASDPS